jgi:hypothetical protein
MKLTSSQIKEQSDHLSATLRIAIGNAKTSYCIRENMQRLASVFKTWLTTVEGDPCASKWLDHLRKGGKQETDLDSLKEASVKFKEFESMELDFEPYMISLENIPEFLKTAIMSKTDDGPMRIDHWEDNPAATDNLIHILRIIGAIKGD